MISLRVIPNPHGGYVAETDLAHQHLGLWLDEIQEGGDSYDIEGLWHQIGAHTRLERPPISQTINELNVHVDHTRVTITICVFRSSIVLELAELAEVTERWFDVVAPPVAASLRRIRASWKTSHTATSSAARRQ